MFPELRWTFCQLCWSTTFTKSNLKSSSYKCKFDTIKVKRSSSDKEGMQVCETLTMHGMSPTISGVRTYLSNHLAPSGPPLILDSYSYILGVVWKRNIWKILGIFWFGYNKGSKFIKTKPWSVHGLILFKSHVPPLQILLLSNIEIAEVNCVYLTSLTFLSQRFERYLLQQWGAALVRVLGQETDWDFNFV